MVTSFFPHSRSCLNLVMQVGECRAPLLQTDNDEKTLKMREKSLHRVLLIERCETISVRRCRQSGFLLQIDIIDTSMHACMCIERGQTGSGSNCQFVCYIFCFPKKNNSRLFRCTVKQKTHCVFVPKLVDRRRWGSMFVCASLITLLSSAVECVGLFATQTYSLCLTLFSSSSSALVSCTVQIISSFLFLSNTFLLDCC